MNTALKEAVIAEIIPSNPMDRIESVKKEVYIPEFYTDDELIELIEVIKTQKLELPLTLGIIYGLRREEILGLTWNAIDFKNKSITIRKTVGRGKSVSESRGADRFGWKHRSFDRISPPF